MTILKNIKCRIGFHSWKIIKQIGIRQLYLHVSRNYFIGKKYKPLKFTDNIRIKDRICVDCNIKDLEVKYMIRHLYSIMKIQE